VPTPDIERLGERALRVVLGPEWASDLGGRAALSRALLEVAGVRDALVGESHALVVVDDLSRDDLHAALFSALARCQGAPLTGCASIEVEVRYDGCDLGEGARAPPGH